MSANNNNRTHYNRYKSRILEHQYRLMNSANNKAITKSHILGSLYRLTLMAEMLGIPYNRHARNMGYYFPTNKGIFNNLYLPNTNVKYGTGNSTASNVRATNVMNVRHQNEALNLNAIKSELQNLETQIKQFEKRNRAEMARAYRSALLAIKRKRQQSKK